MLSCSLCAGMTTSTVTLRQSRAGVAGVVSAPRMNPIALTTVDGLKTKCGSWATVTLASG